MNTEFYQYSNDGLRENVTPSEMWCFTYGKSETGDYFMPIELFEDHKIKTLVALAEGEPACEFMGRAYFNTKWLSERFEDTLPYVNKLQEMIGSAKWWK